MPEKQPSPEVDAAKRDLSYFLSILGVNSDRSSNPNAPCIGCGDKTCLQYGPDKTRQGEWYWHCYKGCGNGDVIEAMVKLRGMSYKDAFARIRTDFADRVSKPSAHTQYHSNRATQHQRQGINPSGYVAGVVPALERLGNAGQLPAPPRLERQECVIDLDRADRYVNDAHEYLLSNPDLLTKWERGISLETCIRHRVGFIEFGKIQYAPWQKPMDIPAAWVLPITDEEGNLRAVKLHFEERPNWGSRECPKLMWLPFGTVPAYDNTKRTEDGKTIETKPVHSYLTMWPHPDTLQPQVNSDFTTDASFWIQRIPDSLRPDWDMLVDAQRYKVAYERECVVEDLSEVDIWDAQLRAFEEMKKKIFAAVLKTEDVDAQYDPKKTKRETDWSSYVFICPGELKALACESAGLMATAGTGGESVIPGPSILSRFSGKKICLFGDLDPPKRILDKSTHETRKVFCTGREWVGKWISALEPHRVTSIVTKWGGQKGGQDGAV